MVVVVARVVSSMPCLGLCGAPVIGKQSKNKIEKILADIQNRNMKNKTSRGQVKFGDLILI